MLTSVLGFFGGLGIFLYGTHVLGNALQKLGASKMRQFLVKITDTRIRAILSGVLVTFFLQSSTVTNIILVGLVGESLISLTQAFGVVLGSAVGTTLTVQILTFNVSKYATIFIFIGVVFAVFSERNRWKTIGNMALSIGFIFFGIGLITESLEPIGESPAVLQFLINLAEKPILFGLISAGITALMHSSAATIIIGIAFMTSGFLTLSDILPLVLGANLGTTIPVVISSLASRSEGKKLAIFYFLFKLIGVSIVFPFLFFIADFIQLFPGNIERQVAHFHTVFNIFIVLLFFPFLSQITSIFAKLIPEAKKSEGHVVYLEDSLLKVPEEALYSSRKEVFRLAKMIKEKMICQLKSYVIGKVSANEIYAVEQTIDQSYVYIQQFLLKLGQKDLTKEQSNEEVKLLNILNDLEHIGDMIVRFVDKIEEIDKEQISLTESDQKQLFVLLHYIERTYQHSLKAFKNNDLEIAKQNIQLQSEINQFEKDVKFDHFNSLIHKKEYDPTISAIYLDVINQLFQVYHHTINISKTVLGII